VARDLRQVARGAPGGSAGGARVDGGADGPSAGASCAASPSTVWGGPQPGPAGITSLWSIARNDVLALGTGLSRWDGTNWTAFSPQPPPGSAFPASVTASADDDIWLTQFASQRGYFVTRWNGTTWSDVTPSVPSGGGWGVPWLAARNDAWVAVQLPTPPTVDLTEIPQPALYHWTGSDWTLTPSPLDSIASGALVGPFWGSSPSDVWAFVATDTTSGFIHWNGEAWTTAVDTLSGIIYAVWGSSATDIWAGGWTKSDLAVMWHFDGTSWREVDFTFTGFFSQLWGSCSGDFWATSSNGSAGSGLLWHYDGSAWSGVVLGSFQPGSITGSSPDDVWMTIQNSSTLRHRQPGFCGDGTTGSGEQCDPPAQGPDGLQCGSDCQLLTCGNGVVDPGEQCDPPKSTGSAGLCTQNCQIPACGNGAIDPGETCDPPNTSTCDSRCQSIPIVCGNGIVQPGEQCEFPDGKYCQSCQLTTCGNCFVGHCVAGRACAALSGADAINCFALESCLFPNGETCAQGNQLIACFCSNDTCSAGFDHGNGCTSQLEALGHSTDPAVLAKQLTDPSSIFSKIAGEYSCFTSTGCGPICAGVLSP
jgi:hypothetical protein